MKTLKEIIRKINVTALRLLRNGRNPQNIPELCKWAREYDLPVTIFSKEDSGNSGFVNLGVSLQKYKLLFSGKPTRNNSEDLNKEIKFLAEGLCDYQAVTVLTKDIVYLSENKYSVVKP